MSSHAQAHCAAPWDGRERSVLGGGDLSARTQRMTASGRMVSLSKQTLGRRHGRARAWRSTGAGDAQVGYSGRRPAEGLVDLQPLIGSALLFRALSFL